MIAVFWMAILGTQIAYCLLLVFAFTEETKRTLVHGVGLPMIFANWLIAAWAVAFAFQSFLPCVVLIALSVVLLLFVNMRLYIMHPPSIRHPIDYLFLHAPLRLFLLLPLNVLLPLSVFLMQGHTWAPGKPDQYNSYQWEGAAVIIASGVLALILVAWRHDFVWGGGTMWLHWSIGSARPKAAPVFISIIVFTVLIPLTFVVSLIVSRVHKHREGRIRLEEQDEDYSPERHSHHHHQANGS